MEIGSPAFNFEIPDQHGHIHKLSDYAGKTNVLLSFHIYSFTKGCTNQMTGFRAAYPKFKELNTEILGISCDAQPTQTAYSTSLGNLPYPVLSDFHPKGQISKEYEIYNEDIYDLLATYKKDRFSININRPKMQMKEKDNRKAYIKGKEFVVML